MLGLVGLSNQIIQCAGLLITCLVIITKTKTET